MTQCLEDVSFQPLIERRRPISDILPPSNEEPEPARVRWMKIAAILVAVFTVITIQTYSKYRTTTPSAILRLSFEAVQLYRWFGFHRVAP